MATDLETRPDEDQDAIQRHYDDTFNDLTSAEHMAKDGTPGDIGDDEGGFFRDESTPKAKADDETPAKSESKKDETGTSSGDSGLFSGDEGPKQKRRFGLSRKQWSITGGVFGLGFGGGGLILLSTLVGPFQAFNYSSILTKPQASQTSAMSSRLSKAYRYAKTGDIGETRLSFVGSYFYGKAQAALAKQGIKTTNGVTGLKSIEVDVEKNGTYNGLSQEEAIKAFEADNPGSKVNSFKDGVMKVDASRMTIGDTRNFISRYMKSSDLGFIDKQIAMRGMAKAFGAPSWFHPLTRVSQAADRRAAAIIREKAAADEDSRLKKLVEKSDKIKAFNETVNEKLNPGMVKAVGRSLLITGAICTVKGISDEIPQINQYNVIIPAVQSAGDAIAIGSQVTSGRDVDLFAVGAAVDKFEDSSGKSVWQSEGVQKLEDPTSKGGKPIKDDTGNAFGPGGGYTTVSKVLNELGGGYVCSTIGQGVQIVVGAVLTLTGAGGVVEKLVQTGISVGVGMAIGHFANDVAAYIASDPITGTPHQGPDGGNIDAYGSVALANASARQQGGSELSPAQTAVLMQQQEKASAEEFASKSFVARVFDAHDYRSLMGKFIDSQSPNATQNVSSMFSHTLNIFSNLGHMFSSLSSTFMPKASAATTANGWYNLGYDIRQYGFSDTDLNSSLVDNPYDNADKVAELYKNGTIDGGMQDRIQTCFGVKFVTDSGGKLDTQPGDSATAGQDGEGGPNPNSPEYESANCSDNSETWTRIRFFIMDLTAVKGAACYEGDGQSCLDLGVTQQPTATNVCTGTATPGTPPSTGSSSGLPDWSVLPDVSSQPIGNGVTGQVSMAIANIRSSDTFTHNLGIIDHNNPDFIGIQETSNESVPHMEQSAPGYGVYRDSTPDPDSADANQVMDNTIMWNKSRWELLDSGRVKITNHDHVVFEGHDKDWNRYAAWGMFKRKSDGAIVSFISTHMMTAPDSQQQWGTLNPPMTRTQQYELSMENLKQLVGVLGQHGPVLVGGDMNVTENDTRSWAPGPQMKAIGYGSSSDRRVLLSFNPQGTTVTNNQIVHLDLHDDHNNGSIQTTIAMNGAGPTTFNGSVVTSSGCSSGTYTNNLKPGNAETPDPSVVQGDDGTYHIYASGFQHLTSTDAVTWKVVGGDSQIFKGGAPGWLGADHWAPEVSKTGDHWTLVFSGGNPKRIGYATASSAGGPFTYQGILVQADPSESGYVIDPHLLAINNGTYILYYGSDKNHGISAVKLGLSGTTLSQQGNTIQALKPDMDQYTTEGSYVVKHGSWYYMYYSVGDYRVHGDYRTRIARSNNPFALFDKKPSGNTILDGNSAFVGPGGGSVLTDAAGQDWLYYHAQVANGNNDRLLMLDKITYGSDDWPTINSGNGPTNTEQQGPSLTGTTGSTSTGTVPTVSPGDPAIKIHTPALLQHENLPGSPSPGKQPLYITPKGITLHWWGGSGGIDWLYNTLKGRGLSVQFGITNDGQIYQMMTKETSWAAQATGGNNTTFGIEIEGTGNASGSPDFGANGPANNPKKFAAVVHLVTYLVKKYHLPLTGHLVCEDVVGIHPHKDYNTICPQYGNANKSDIDDAYFNAVMTAVKQQPGIQ